MTDGEIVVRLERKFDIALVIDLLEIAEESAREVAKEMERVGEGNTVSEFLALTATQQQRIAAVEHVISRLSEALKETKND